jgi:dienelactone hydrolase
MRSLPLLIFALALAVSSNAVVVPQPGMFDDKVPWVVPTDLVERLGKNQPRNNYDEAKVPPWRLPPLLQFSDGKPVASAADWTRRRGELLAVFRSDMFGVSPPRPDGLRFDMVEMSNHAMDGAATLKRVAASFVLSAETFTFHITLFIPNKRNGPVPVFLLLNHRSTENTDPSRQKKSDFWPAEQIIARGYAAAVINVAAEVDPDDAVATQTKGVRSFYRKHHSKAAEFTWGTLAAWAWSGSRAMDYFETDADIDSERVAVIGHSRTGKTALWAGASDERFALVCVNGAGAGGPAPARRHFGETLGQLTSRFPHWFTPRYGTYADRIDELPVDAHQLIALVSPRGYHGGDGATDLWADPRGSWLALVEASKAWAILGKGSRLDDQMPLVNDLRIAGPLAYHIRSAGHDLMAFDWQLYLDHADTLWRRQDQ